MQFQWRHHSDGVGSDTWQADLAQLSGGQRSLVAIALLVAVSSKHSDAELQQLTGLCSTCSPALLVCEVKGGAACTGFMCTTLLERRRESAHTPHFAA